MPRSKRNKKYRKIQERTLYIIKNPITKEFYIGHTLSHNMRSTYKDHYIEIKNKTKNTIKQLKINGLKPCCFELETIECTAVQAYRYIIVWTKIFMEQGYINLDTGTIVDYATNLLPENIPLYEERKKKKLHEILVCKNCLFPEYGRNKCPLKKENKE